MTETAIAKTVVGGVPVPTFTLQKFDDRTEGVLSGLLPVVEMAFRSLLADIQNLCPPGVVVKLISGHRSFKEQQALYDQGRTKPGKIVTNAKPGSSWHNFGMAGDIGFFIKSTNQYLPESDLYHRAGEQADKHGFKWGGTFKKNPDYPHFEYLGGITLRQARDRVLAGKPVLNDSPGQWGFYIGAKYAGPVLYHFSPGVSTSAAMYPLRDLLNRFYGAESVNRLLDVASINREGFKWGGEWVEAETRKSDTGQTLVKLRDVAYWLHVSFVVDEAQRRVSLIRV